MSSKSGRVGSFDEIRMEKIALPYIITSAYIERIHILGNLAIPQSEVLMRQAQINRLIESFLYPYTPADSSYWEDSGEYTKFLTFEYARMPQHHTQFMNNLTRWDRLIAKEEARNNLLLTKSVAGRV